MLVDRSLISTTTINFWHWVYWLAKWRLWIDLEKGVNLPIRREICQLVEISKVMGLQLTSCLQKEEAKSHYSLFSRNSRRRHASQVSWEGSWIYGTVETKRNTSWFNPPQLSFPSHPFCNKGIQTQIHHPMYPRLDGLWVVTEVGLPSDWRFRIRSPGFWSLLPKKESHWRTIYVNVGFFFIIFYFLLFKKNFFN